MTSVKLSNKEKLDKYLSSKVSESAAQTSTNSDLNLCNTYAVLRNIPKHLHSKDLRKYFNKFIENEKFQCFHYRHRPELQEENSVVKTSTCCCVISFKNEIDREEFIKEFNGRHWLNADGLEIPRRCFVDRMKIQRSAKFNESSNCVSESDLKEMIEMKPPAVMPNGNIGTSSSWFLEQIRLCKMPASLIPKLGIQANKKVKKFGEVPFNYGDDIIECSTSDIIKEEHETIKESEEDPTEKIKAWQNPKDNDEDSEKDDDQCEEWERHESLHNDVTEQDRTKPKKYEEEMEVTWEKGGPGLVWYTDKNYWDEREKGTDCDWAWADDWDVDYSVYYEGKSAGDLDSQAAVEMHRDEMKWTGKLDESVFVKPKNFKLQKRKRRSSDSETNVSNEKPENTVGGKMLSKMGWKTGKGLGKFEQGKTIPVSVFVEEDGQSGKEKKGFGYRGEKMSRVVKKIEQRHIIASVFDKVTDQHLSDDKQDREILFRNSEPSKMKYS